MKSLPKNIVKICGLTRPEDVRFSIAAGASAVGFVFAPSPRRVDIEVGQQLSEAGNDALRVGVMRELSGSEILKIADNVELDVLQLHDEPSDDLLAGAIQRGLLIFRVHHRGEISTPPTTNCAALLLDNPSPGSGELNDFEQFDEQPLGAPLIYAGGLTPSNVESVIHQFHPFGVDVSSGVELSVGVKDYAKVSSFITTAQRAFEDK